MSGITKAQAARAAELATKDELELFWEWHKLECILHAMGDLAAVDAIARDARKLVRAILKRADNKYSVKLESE